MDNFEKQQRIDSIRGIIKARWFSIFIIVALGLVLKINYFGGIWGNWFDIFKILGLGFIVSGYNFIFWIFIRRPEEKIGIKALNVISAFQVISDQLIYTLIYYYTGTVETIAFLLYFLTILIASSIYKTRGIILTSVLAIVLYSSATLADFYKIVPHVYSFPGNSGWFGHLFMLRTKIVGFLFYTVAAAVFSVFLSALIRKREAGLLSQRDQLSRQTEILVNQNKELTETKNWLHEALTKSDKAKADLSYAKEELEKVNLELRSKIAELEKFNKVTVGREIKMIELKKEIEELKDRS